MAKFEPRTSKRIQNAKTRKGITRPRNEVMGEVRKLTTYLRSKKIKLPIKMAFFRVITTWCVERNVDVLGVAKSLLEIPEEQTSLPESASEIEIELEYLQWKLRELQTHRQELCVQLSHLSDKSQNLPHQMQWPITNKPLVENSNVIEASTSSTLLRASPVCSQWMETDLDICSENKPENHHNNDDGLFSTDLSENPQSNLYQRETYENQNSEH